MARFYGTILSHADNLNNYHEARHTPMVNGSDIPPARPTRSHRGTYPELLRCFASCPSIHDSIIVDSGFRLTHWAVGGSLRDWPKSFALSRFVSKLTSIS